MTESLLHSIGWYNTVNQLYFNKKCNMCFIFKKHLFIYLALPGLNCGMWELVP